MLQSSMKQSTSNREMSTDSSGSIAPFRRASCNCFSMVSRPSRSGSKRPRRPSAVETITPKRVGSSSAQEEIFSGSCITLTSKRRSRSSPGPTGGNRLSLKAARRAKALLEAYPIDTRRPRSTSNLFTGVASTFARAGFKTVARRAPHRPIMRYDF